MSATPEPEQAEQREEWVERSWTDRDIGLRTRALFESIASALATTGLDFLTHDGRDGRSYLVGGRPVLRIDPKQDFLRIRVPPRWVPRIPPALRHPERQPNWMVVRPAQCAPAIAFITKVVTQPSPR